MSRDYKLYLDDIIDSSHQVLEYTAGYTYDSFVSDRKTYDAVLRNLSIIGEAVRSIPQEVKDRYPEVEWRLILGFRNVAIHTYFGLDDRTVWDIVQNKIPILLGQARRVLVIEDQTE